VGGVVQAQSSRVGRPEIAPDLNLGGGVAIGVAVDSRLAAVAAGKLIRT